MEFYMRETAKVSRKLLSAMTGVIHGLKKNHISGKVREYSYCDLACSKRNLPTAAKNHLCAKHCPFNVPKNEVEYVYEKSDYKISDELASHRFSKSQIIQLLFYHFLVEGSVGLVTDLSNAFIAKALNICESTVINNNKIFEKLDIITIQKGLPARYHIIINDYERSYRKKEDGGIGGYIDMPLTMFEEVVLKKQERVALVYALRTYLASSGGLTKATMTYEELKCFTPKGLHYPKAFERTMKKMGVCMSVFFTQDYVEVVTKDAINSEKYKMKKSREADEIARNLEEDFEVELNKDDYMDIRQLALEYGVDNLYFAARELFEGYKDSIVSGLLSIGAGLRKRLKEATRKSRAAFTMQRRQTALAS